MNDFSKGFNIGCGIVAAVFFCCTVLPVACIAGLSVIGSTMSGNGSVSGKPDRPSAVQRILEEERENIDGEHHTTEPQDSTYEHSERESENPPNFDTPMPKVEPKPLRERLHEGLFLHQVKAMAEDSADWRMKSDHKEIWIIDGVRCTFVYDRLVEWR